MRHVDFVGALHYRWLAENEDQARPGLSSRPRTCTAQEGRSASSVAFEPPSKADQGPGVVRGSVIIPKH